MWQTQRAKEIKRRRSNHPGGEGDIEQGQRSNIWTATAAMDKIRSMRKSMRGGDIINDEAIHNPEQLREQVKGTNEVRFHFRFRLRLCVCVCVCVCARARVCVRSGLQCLLSCPPRHAISFRVYPARVLDDC